MLLGIDIGGTKCAVILGEGKIMPAQLGEKIGDMAALALASMIGE